MTIESQTFFSEKGVRCPILKGEPSNVVLITPKAIDQSTLLVKSMTITINAAFTEQSQRTKVLNSHQRIVPGGNSIFEQQLGNDTTTFCIIVSQQTGRPEEEFVAGTIAARRFPTSSLPIERSSLTPQDEQLTTRSIFTRTEIPNQYKKSVFWELKLLAVHPSMQGQRLGKWLMDTVEMEIKRRTLEKNPNAKEVIIVLTTVTEHAASLYLKRGYTIDSQQTYPSGTANSEKGFTIVHMYKRYELP
jgi:GNAT superfamily N-acetyltransferase